MTCPEFIEGSKSVRLLQERLTPYKNQPLFSPPTNLFPLSPDWEYKLQPAKNH